MFSSTHETLTKADHTDDYQSLNFNRLTHVDHIFSITMELNYKSTNNSILSRK